MTITEDVISQVSFMAPELIDCGEEMLRTVCASVVSSLTARLRDDIDPEDYQSEFVTAAGMYAVAALTELSDLSRVEQLTAGDLTVRKSNVNHAADYLRRQADMLMAPFTKAGFSFLGV